MDEPMVTAVKEALEKASLTPQPCFDVRAQIKENAQYLWPRARAHYLRSPGVSRPSSHGEGATHSMSLTIRGQDIVSAHISAQITISKTSDAGNHVHEAVFLQGHSADSPEKALHNLLKVTMGLIEREKVNGLSFGEGISESVGRCGWMEVPNGKCEHCGEAVWM
ncbi:hypothetical protein LTS10_010519 [Elasticomyces elasticus]|nr:hypothetical protein LTS10_010519 [Elasticomyces elasticus]